MRATLYDTLVGFKGNATEFHDLLQKMQVMDIFGNMYAVYPEHYKARKAILYILYAYSIDSPFILRGEAANKSKNRAAEEAGLIDDQYNDLVLFKYRYETKQKPTKTKAAGKEEVDEIKEDDGTETIEANDYIVGRIISCINKYFAYQNDREHTHIMRMKDHYEQVAIAAHSMIKKNSAGDIDWKQKAECQDQANKLLKEIEEWEQKLANKNAELKPAIEEVKETERRITRSIRPETVVN